MWRRPGWAARRLHCLLKHCDGFQRIGAFSRLARRDVPQLPRRPIHDRLGEQRRYVKVIAETRINLAHRRSIVVVPDRRDGIGAVVGVTVKERGDECLLDGCPLLRQRLRLQSRLAGKFQRAGEVGRIKGFPLLVVVGPSRIGDTPLRHGALRIGLCGGLEAAHRLVVIVAVAP
jgi:hypothetical protein